MKRLWYFLKWNFTDVQPYVKRMMLYFVVACVLEYFIYFGLLFFWVAILLDMLIDSIHRRYQEFKKEQTDILDALKK